MHMVEKVVNSDYQLSSKNEKGFTNNFQIFQGVGGRSYCAVARKDGSMKSRVSIIQHLGERLNHV